jgi:predicted TIM-barrel fold metal-dependent hydrolase
MNPAAAAKIAALASRLEEAGESLVVDADTHISDLESLSETERRRHDEDAGYYHGRPVSAEELIREMDLARVDMALVWQNPASTVYTGDPARNTEALLAANRYVCRAAERYPARLIPAGWVDPRACGVENTLRLVETLVAEFGFFMVKLNPAQNRFMMDSPEALAVMDRIVELGAVPAFHFGADTPYTPAGALRTVAERHPDRPVVAVHMGGGGAGYLEAEQLYGEARALGLERPNIRYVLSAKRDAHMESDLVAYQAAGEPFRRHLFCGSDAPYGRMAWNFGGFRALLRGLEETRPDLFGGGGGAGGATGLAASNYLGGNFARFAAESCRRLLDGVCR